MLRMCQKPVKFKNLIERFIETSKQQYLSNQSNENGPTNHVETYTNNYN